MPKHLSSNFESVGWSAMKYSGVGVGAHGLRTLHLVFRAVPFPLPKHQVLPPGSPRGIQVELALCGMQRYDTPLPPLPAGRQAAGGRAVGPRAAPGGLDPRRGLHPYYC
jgi:hypothetical protein